VSSALPEFASNHQEGSVGSRTLLQQNALVVNCGCQLTQVDLSDGRKTIVFLNNKLCKISVRRRVKQVVKVIQHKAVSPPHMDDSVVFAR